MTHHLTYVTIHRPTRRPHLLRRCRRYQEAAPHVLELHKSAVDNAVDAFFRFFLETLFKSNWPKSYSSVFEIAETLQIWAHPQLSLDKFELKSRLSSKYGPFEPVVEKTDKTYMRSVRVG